MNILCYDTNAVIEIIMCIIMILVIVLTFLRSFLNMNGEKIINKNGVITTENNKVGGIGARSIQFVCVSLIIPTIIILAIEKIIMGETVATIIGGLIGFVLSGISNFDNK